MVPLVLFETDHQNQYSPIIGSISYSINYLAILKMLCIEHENQEIQQCYELTTV